jgi:DNA-binding transcriptional regulator YiaG
MTPADFKTLRESLGLSARWLADRLSVDQRTVRRWGMQS